MKLGLGLYRHQLNRDHYAFARQCGATHIVAHLVDYFHGGQGNPRGNQPTGGAEGWGRAGDPDHLWTLDELRSVQSEIEAVGLTLEAIENLDPAHWYDILLDGPRRDEQVDNVRTLIRRLGSMGIPVLGYNFSLAGVTDRITGPFARGGATSVGMHGISDRPIPAGMVWNMVYDPDPAAGGHLPDIDHDELWRRFSTFLADVLPIAEEAGVALALHPDDPPAPFVRRQPRLVYRPELYQRVIDIAPSPANQFEFCVGTLAEMPNADIYETVERYAGSGRIAYVHLRNITGKAPHYRETFIDDGDVDIIRILRILRDGGFKGVVIPDHTPQLTCDAPWHAGMAHALGFIAAAQKTMS